MDHATFPTDTARWEAVQARDAAADGDFVYAVRSTGVYCRPSCPSRPKRRENVSFHAGPAAAEVAGFRACRRCRPDGTAPAAAAADRIAAVCRLIEAAETPPPLAELAAAAGLSPYHFHRAFRAAMGVTPKAYADAVRARRLRAALEEGAQVTTAIFDAGFNSSGRFYAQSGKLLGMTPRAWRDGGAGETIQWAIAPCPFGQVLVAATARGLCSIAFGADRAGLQAELAQRFPSAALEEAAESLGARLADVVAWLEQPARGLDLPLDMRGTAFQQRVWQALQAIPPGSTQSYGGLAASLGAPRAVRAVAHAVAANPLAVIVPCHRVVGADGGLTGYRWGLERKRALLARERG